MEGSEENAVPKRYSDDEHKHQSHQQHVSDLGLGFQSSPSVEPDPNRDRPNHPPDDLDQKSAIEEYQIQQVDNLELQIEQAINGELQTQVSINEEPWSQQSINEELHNWQPVSEEILKSQTINGELQNLVLEEKEKVSEETMNPQTTINEDFQSLVLEEKGKVSQASPNPQTSNDGRQNLVLEEKEKVSEVLLNPQSINEELQNLDLTEKEKVNRESMNPRATKEGLQNLVLEEKKKVKEKGSDHEEDVEGAENEANREVDIEGENNDVKGEESVDDGNDSWDGKRSENDKEYDNGSENIGVETDILVGTKDGRYRNYNYPVRPDAEDCSYYMRTGMCKFGPNCKFNHPPRGKNQGAKEKVKDKEEISGRQGQTECKYYLTSGGCKYGKACRYNHSRGKTPVAPIVEFNFLGLPIRLGEKECPFYMRNGSCKYGSNCRFNHPDPSAVGGGDAASGYGNGGSVSLPGASQSTMPSWSSPRPLNETGPFVPMMFPAPKGVPSPNPEWNGYQPPVYPAPERALPTPPAFALNIPAEPNFYTPQKQHMLVDEFPERPGQPDCSYFLKTGDCKYRSGCKFHHPKNRNPKTTAACVLSDKGLPLRPDQNVCSHYNRYGICKFGPACKFDHPVNYVVSGTDRPSSFGNSGTGVGARMAGGESGSEALMQQPV